MNFFQKMDSNVKTESWSLSWGNSSAWTKYDIGYWTCTWPFAGYKSWRWCYNRSLSKSWSWGYPWTNE